jgi:hypothetical protein
MNTPAFLGIDHIQQLMAAVHGDMVRVLDVQPFAVDNSASILVTLTAKQTERRIGHYGLQVVWEVAGQKHANRFVLKVKPPGSEIAQMLAGLAQASDGELGDRYQPFLDSTGFANTHLRELFVYRDLQHPIHAALAGFHLDEKADRYELLLEDLSDHELLNTVMKIDTWTEAHIYRALSDLAAWHVFAKAELNNLAAKPWADTDHDNYWQDQAPLWQVLLAKGRERFPELYTSDVFTALQTGLKEIDNLQALYNSLPKTLIHNDANPRNACFREDGSFCLYDWELACQGVPVYDVVELLSFVVSQSREQNLPKYLQHYREAICARWPSWADDQLWQQSLSLAWHLFGWHRLGMYSMAHAVAPYPFLPQVFSGYRALGEMLGIIGSKGALQQSKQEELSN